MAFAEYAEYDGLGLAALVAKGQVTPLELATAYGTLATLGQRVPPRILEQPRDIGTDQPSVPPFSEMLAEYYRLRQWDPTTGAIAAEVIQRLGLPEPILAPRQPVAV